MKNLNFIIYAIYVTVVNENKQLDDGNIIQFNIYINTYKYNI